MANEKLACNQICRFNDPSDGCVKPTHATCPLSNAEPDASGWGQVQENKKRLIDANALMFRVDESKKANPHTGKLMVNHHNEHNHFLRMIFTAPTVDAVEVVHGYKPGDVCFYGFAGENKSIALVEIVKVGNDERGIAEIRFLKVFVDDTGNGMFDYLLRTGQTMNASFKYLKNITPIYEEVNK